VGGVDEAFYRHEPITDAGVERAADRVLGRPVSGCGRSKFCSPVVSLITSLAGSLAYPRPPGCATLEGDGDVVLIQLPQRGVMVPMSRRALLAALGVGATAGPLAVLHEATAGVVTDEELLTDLTESLRGLHSAGRVLPPATIVDALLGQVASLDVLRRRAPQHLRREFVVLQAQCADHLSGMVQESGDVIGTLYWADRSQHWADQADWPAMTAYSHVRRSTLASSGVGDGPAAVEHAARALRTPGAPALVKGLAAKQMAYGYALGGHSDACHQALDRMAKLFQTASTRDRDPDPVISLAGFDVPTSLAQYEGTCDVYLGGGETAVPLIDSGRAPHGSGSRNHAITGARLARAYAQAGDPEQACAEAIEALGTGEVVDSLSTRVELRRALKPLDRWPGREDVAEVRHRIGALA
jgi:hypothetical protein